VTTILAFLFVLGVLVFVHELGHFLAARRIGVRVLTFSLGFGPKLLSTKRGDTEYAISAIPLGGYVKMAGESVEDPRSGAPDEFLSKTKWQRFQVLIMGPVMNILLAVIVMAVVLAQGAEVPAYHDEPPVVGAVTPGSPAEKAGLRRGDRVLAVAGNEVPTWDRFDIEIGTRAVGAPIRIGITRVHMEEDAGKSIHDRFSGATAIDLNRSGVPLIEIVSEPDLRSAAEAGAYLRTLKQILEYLEVSDVNMEFCRPAYMHSLLDASMNQAVRGLLETYSGWHNIYPAHNKYAGGLFPYPPPTPELYR